MNQGTHGYRYCLMKKKTEDRKSRDTVPLIRTNKIFILQKSCFDLCAQLQALSGIDF
jgi:hypothetical protein